MPEQRLQEPRLLCVSSLQVGGEVWRSQERRGGWGKWWGGSSAHGEQRGEMWVSFLAHPPRSPSQPGGGEACSGETE